MKHLYVVPVVVTVLLSDWSLCSVYNEYSREDLLKYREEVRDEEKYFWIFVKLQV